MCHGPIMDPLNIQPYFFLLHIVLDSTKEKKHFLSLDSFSISPIFWLEIGFKKSIFQLFMISLLPKYQENDKNCIHSGF